VVDTTAFCLIKLFNFQDSQEHYLDPDVYEHDNPNVPRVFHFSGRPRDVPARNNDMVRLLQAHILSYQATMFPAPPLNRTFNDIHGRDYGHTSDYTNFMGEVRPQPRINNFAVSTDKKLITDFS
jgi:hypothetical protein